MAETLSIEQMGNKLGSFESKLDTFIASFKGMDEKHDKEKETAIKKANDEKEEMKKEVKRGALEAAIKKANEEHDPDKKEAGIRKAMSDYGHDENDEKQGKKGMTDEEHKEHKEAMVQVASVIVDKKIDIDNKILQASAMTNPAGIAALKLKLEKGTFTASKQIYDTMEETFGKHIFQANVIPQPTVTAPPPFFMAGAMNIPAEVDANTLNASSSLSEFSKLSTKELLAGKTS